MAFTTKQQRQPLDRHVLGPQAAVNSFVAVTESPNSDPFGAIAGGHSNSSNQFFPMCFAELFGISLQIRLMAKAHFFVLRLPSNRTARSQNSSRQQQSGERLEISRQTNDLPGWT